MDKKPTGIREVEEITEVDPGPIALSPKPTETYQLSISGIWVNSGGNTNSEELRRSETPVDPERDMGKQKQERKKLKARAREIRGSTRARLSSMEEEVETSTGLNDRIKGVKLSRDSEPITHLQFADDLFLFAHAREIDADGIIERNNSFSAWSGQKINLSKFVIMFSKNVSPLVKSRLANMLRINASNKREKYLGLPLVSGKEKRMVLQEVIDKVNSRLQGWKIKVLSQAARGSLIRSVSSSIPSYHMSSLLLPKSICKKLDSINRNFWWGIVEKKHGLFLRSWDSICLPKWAGGIGIRKTEDLNKALVAKLSWEMASNSGKKWVQLFRKKYVKHRNFMKMQCPKYASWAAMSIFKCRDVLSNGLCHKIGNGWEWVKCIIDPKVKLGLREEESHHFQLYASIVCDRIWMQRNMARLGEDIGSVVDLARKIQSSFNKQKTAWEEDRREKLELIESSWTPPPTS
ncbi:hypothetical protein SO802_020420 [Lithocarpus litseifolius]|uniref:Reverse transcriptase n=1 Tax=Lithocarpus litseifolius TaxID=425828 RepID=A0AAW2CFW0_9ROSI